MDTDLDKLCQEGEIDISQVPMLKKAKDILQAIKKQREVRPLQGELHQHNVWMYGDPGKGKTGWYVDYFKDNGGYYRKDKSKYWSNYEDQQNIVINDIE